MAMMKLSISQHHVHHLHVPSLLSHVRAPFAAKKRNAMAIIPVKRRRVTDDSDIEMVDADEVTHDNSMYFFELLCLKSLT